MTVWMNCCGQRFPQILKLYLFISQVFYIGPNTRALEMPLVALIIARIHNYVLLLHLGRLGALILRATSRPIEGIASSLLSLLVRVGSLTGILFLRALF